MPDDATDKRIKWKSSDIYTATVDDNGLITPHQRGETVITAKAIDGSNVEASYTLYVEPTDPIHLFSYESGYGRNSGKISFCLTRTFPMNGTIQSTI